MAGTAEVGTTPVETVDTIVAGLTVRSSEGGSGSPVVFLHHSFGSPGWVQFYDDLAAGARVVVPDLPGYGGSEQPAWARHPRDLALLVGHWLRNRGWGPVDVVGAGFGGWIAAELATMAPELMSHLVLVGSAGILPQNGRILDQILVNHSMYVQAAFKDQAAYEAVYGTDLGDDLLYGWDISREMTTRVAWKPYMYNRQMVPVLPEVEVPTLVVWGDSDGVVPLECGERFVELLPNARLEIVADCGHAVDLERPAVLADLVRSHIR